MAITASATATEARRQPSLRRRLLLFLLVPTLLLMLLDAVFVYFVALRYSNTVHDRDLAYSTIGLARALVADQSGGRLPQETSKLLENDPDGRTYFSIRSLRHGNVSRSAARIPQSRSPRVGAPPTLYDAAIGVLRVRAATVAIASVQEPGDTLFVSMAETLHDREMEAREILLITVPIEAALIAVLLALVWQGVNVGLRVLDVPIRRLATRERNLAPISGPDIPIEILPMTRTIDALFERVQTLVAFQERFVTDAAHQLRTPLAGLAMHVERASGAKSADDVQAALVQIRALTGRVTRSATQLLALARLQEPQAAAAPMLRLDLVQWLPEVIATRIPESLQAGIDLGYEGPDSPVVVDAERNALQELIDNLIDNALRHVGRGGTITVSLCAGTTAGDGPRVAVDDNGPGVIDDLLPRLGERFFRAPGAVEGGSGLGLAIVRRIAEVHRAQVRFGRSALGGLRVELRFPSAARAGA